MNIYMIVEGAETETRVYPAWMSLLVPNMVRIYDAWDVKDSSYYLFSGGGIPSIFQHISNAVADINSINDDDDTGCYDFLVVCIDTEEENRVYIENKIQEQLSKDGRVLKTAKMVIFEQKVCMETWFLGNRVVFKENPQNPRLSDFIHFYNVKYENPEDMGNYDEAEYATKAQFHHRYLKDIFKERNVKYSKNNPNIVCQDNYLQRLIDRYEDTGHIETFGKWYEFVKGLSK